jgi:hypothetical protein
MCFRIQHVAATQAESNRSTLTMLSILSTTANSNEIKWMQNKTQAKKHNFPINCPKTGANPNQAQCHPDPEQAKRAGRGIACPELVEGDLAFDLPKQLRVPWGASQTVPARALRIKYKPATPAESDSSEQDPVVELVNKSQPQ